MSYRIIPLVVCLMVLLVSPVYALAETPSPAQAAETLRADLLRAQLALTQDAAEAQRLITTAQETYKARLAAGLAQSAPEAQQRIQAGFVAANKALPDGDGSRPNMVRAAGGQLSIG